MPHHKTSRQSTVLIVDDQPVNIQSMSKLLSRDYHILIATSGAKALDIAAGENPPDLVLLDIMMPEMDGYEVCRRLKANERTRNIPVIFVTVMDATEDEETGLALGAVDYIFKSFQPSIVRARVRNQTERKRAEDALRQANRQLSLMTSITRHDINNKITVILGYLSLVSRKISDPVLEDYCRKMESATTAIQSQIEFTKVYQNIGTNEPQWQDVDKVLPRSHIPATITLDSVLQGMEIYADPMLGRVFFNLLDNSIRHGQNVTEIRVSSRRSEEGLTIMWEDNGVGIPVEEKEKVFERGFGTNTGLGMFLVRDILDITGITIRENGEPGKGARFEITVPKGAWRMAGDMGYACTPAREQPATLPPLPDETRNVTKQQGEVAITTLIGVLKNNELVDDDLLAMGVSFLDRCSGTTSSSEFRKCVENFEYDAAVSLLMKLATDKGVK